MEIKKALYSNKGGMELLKQHTTAGSLVLLGSE
jgi:hypothetical protein